MVRCIFHRGEFAGRPLVALALRRAGGKSHLLEPSPRRSRLYNELGRPGLYCRFASIPFLRPPPAWPLASLRQAVSVLSSRRGTTSQRGNWQCQLFLRSLTLWSTGPALCILLDRQASHLRSDHNFRMLQTRPCKPVLLLRIGRDHCRTQRLRDHFQPRGHCDCGACNRRAR